VPALFQQWAPRLIEAAHIQPGQRVLDIACGTGVLAREAALRVGNSGAVAGLDLTPGMLVVAERLAPAIEWRQGMAEALPYPDHSFDAVVSQFGLMFFQNRQQALREMRRVLVSGGHFAVAVWDSLNTIPAFASEVGILERRAGPKAAAALRAPFLLGDQIELGTLVADAGLNTAVITTRHGTAHFPSIRSLVEADLKGWLPVMGVLLSEKHIEEILDDAESDLSNYVDAQGRLVFGISAHIVAGTKPSG
jgi:SAM-dependent methyltransferase